MDNKELFKQADPISCGVGISAALAHMAYKSHKAKKKDTEAKPKEDKEKTAYVLGFVKQAMATGMTAAQAFEFYKVAGGLGYNPTEGADLRQQAMASGNMVENTPMTTNAQNPFDNLDFENKSPEGPLAMPQDFSQDPEIMRYIQHLTESDKPMQTDDSSFDNIMNSKGVRDPFDNYVAGNSDDLSGTLSGLNEAFSSLGKSPNPDFSPSVANEAVSNVFNQAGNGMRGKLLSDLNLPVPNASISNQVSQPWQ